MEMDKQINPEIMKRREQKQALRDFAPGEGQSSNTYPERKIIKHYTDDGVDTFIREYPQHAPDKFCDMLMDYSNSLLKASKENKPTPESTGEGFPVGQFERKDFYYFLTEGTSPNVRNTLFAGWSKLSSEHYIDEFTQLGQNDFWMSPGKVQITNPSEGFHGWHYDNAGFFVGMREFVIITYLNDVPEGGETEFLYQQVRIKPEKGKTIIFPAAYTHMHRGNPPIKGTKYIATTWASRLPRIDAETQERNEIECIPPSEQLVQYYKHH